MSARVVRGSAHGMSVAMRRGHGVGVVLDGGIGGEEVEGAGTAGAAGSPSVQ
jgi:hypothetical protein